MDLHSVFFLGGGGGIWLVQPKSSLFYYHSPISKVSKLPKLVHKSIQQSTKAKLDHFLTTPHLRRCVKLA